MALKITLKYFIYLLSSIKVSLDLNKKNKAKRHSKRRANGIILMNKLRDIDHADRSISQAISK